MPTIHVNLNYFLELGDLPFPIMLGRLFLDGGWFFVLLLLSQYAWFLWLESRRAKFGAAQSFCVLAIDVPRDNIQTPKAVEQIFSHLSGAHGGFDKYETYWEGKGPSSFSFEIVSIGGYVQFVVRTNTKYRDLVESAFYSQYPGAEIVEIADYVDKIPSHYPDPEWEAFGTEFVLKKKSHIPLRTYTAFEDKSSEEVMFKDPMSAVLEVFSSLDVGEQLWLQFIITPLGDDWKEKGEEEVKKILGVAPKHKPSPLAGIVDIPLGIANMVTTELAGVSLTGEGEHKDEKPAAPKITSMSPGEREVLEAIQTKLSKIAFKTKIRLVYAAKRDKFQKGRVMSGFKGALGQFNALNMNALTGYGKVTPKGDYFYQRWSMHEKESKIVQNYKKRSGKGADAFILNIEELATLYHFPMIGIKTPALKKTEAKRSEPPAGLPVEGMTHGRPFDVVRPKAAPLPPPPEAEEDEDAPADLPFA
jgi:hypothetical protein